MPFHWSPLQASLQEVGGALGSPAPVSIAEHESFPPPGEAAAAARDAANGPQVAAAFSLLFGSGGVLR